MTETTHERAVTWLAEYIKAHPTDLMNFREIRKQMKTAGESFISCYLLDNRFLYGRFLQEARELIQKD